MRIFSVPPTAETLSEPNFYDTMSKIRLRQQLEMYSICKYILCFSICRSTFKVEFLESNAVSKRLSEIVDNENCVHFSEAHHSVSKGGLHEVNASGPCACTGPSKTEKNPKNKYMGLFFCKFCKKKAILITR